MHKRILAGVLLAAAALAAHADFPSQPVRLVVGFPPGGSTDIAARVLAQKLQEKWGQPVVVENRPGAASNIATAQVARAPKDGYTLLMAAAALTVSPAVYEKPGYDAVADLAPITLVATVPNVLVVNPQVPARDAAAFIAYARANPGKLNFSAPGAGTAPRMTFELIKQATGTQVTMVPYQGGAPAMQAVIGGQVDAMVANLTEAAPQVKSGRLRALALTSTRRSPLLPGVPTLEESVGAAINTAIWVGLLAPAGTPQAVIARVQQDTAAVLAQPDAREKLAGMAMEVAGSTPEAFGKLIRDEIVMWKQVARDAGIRPE